MKIGFIGTGKITNSCVRALAGKGHNIFITERNVSISTELSESFDNVNVCSLDFIVSESDVIFLALMENVVDDVLSCLSFRNDQNIISFVLGVDLDRLHNLCAPARDIAITIPLPMIEHGNCPLPVFPKSKALEKIFGSDNLILELNAETELIPYFAATAMLSTSLAQLKVAKTWLEGHLNAKEDAEKYLISLMAGTFSGLKIDGKNRINEALASLATKGGLNAQLREHMKKEGTENALHNGLFHLGKRLNLN